MEIQSIFQFLRTSINQSLFIMLADFARSDGFRNSWDIYKRRPWSQYYCIIVSFQWSRESVGMLIQWGVRWAANSGEHNLQPLHGAPFESCVPNSDRRIRLLVHKILYTKFESPESQARAVDFELHVYALLKIVVGWTHCFPVRRRFQYWMWFVWCISSMACWCELLLYIVRSCSLFHDLLSWHPPY